MAYYGTPKDISKQACEYNLLSATELIGNWQTLKSLPEGLFLKLSEQHDVRVDVEYDCENDDVCGKLIFEAGRVISRQEYTYLHGKYVLDTSPDKENFWYELKIRTEDIFLDDYDSLEELISAELAFLDETEQQQFGRLYQELTD